MGTLGLLKKFKNYIVLIVVPIVLISVFSFVDDRPTVCTPPCTLFASYAQRSSCEKAHKYASTFCQTRCMTNCFEYKNSTQVNSADITIANVELNKSCAKKWVDWKPSYPMPKNMTYAIRSEEITKEELWAHVKNQYDNQECYIVPADSRADVVDALDLTASDKTLVREYKAIFNSKKAAAAYGTLIMCIFWIFEIVPLTVTSIIPLFLFPMLGIVTSKAIAGFYFTSIIALFYGGLLVANAIERVNLHRRLAMFVLTLVGPKPAWILLAFMCITSFISMWVSNVASTIMVLPIAISVIDELKRNLDRQAEEVGFHDTSDTDETKHLLAKESTKNTCDDDIAADFKHRYESQYMMKKALAMAVCYCASIGGTGMIMGTGPNAFFAGSVPQSAGVSVSSYGMYAFPLCWIMTFICWGVLWFFFIRTGREQSEEELEVVKNIINKQYQDLGPVKYGEKTVGIITVCMALLFVFRKLDKDIWGWTDIPGLDTKDIKGGYYIKDSVVAIAMLFLLFILPVDKPSLDPKEPLPKPILEFKSANSKLAWSVLFILGGGFAMAEGIKSSGLAAWIATKLGFLNSMPIPLVVSISVIIIVLMTQVTSNSSTISIFLPVLASIANATKTNPLLIMAPCTVAVSYAFMLPVSTPPNALCMAYGLKTGDLLKVGSVLVAIGTPIVIIWTYIAGGFAFSTMFDPCAEWLVQSDDFDTSYCSAN